jgi:hypothetical protein
MARTTKFKAVQVTETLAVTGASTLTGNVAMAGTLGVTGAFTQGSKVVPNTFIVPVNIPGGATAADFDGLFFIAHFACKVVSVRERHAVAGTNGSAVTLMLKKVPSGTAKASGTDCLSAGIDMKATADTNQSGALHATAANYTLAAGDALGLVPTGTLTSLDGVTLTVELEKV